MHVHEGMTDVVLTVGPGHTLREAAASMCRRQVGAAVVHDPEAPGPGVITERDILVAVGKGEDPDKELVADHLTSNLTFASPDSPSCGRPGRRAGRDPVDARHRALLDGGWSHLRGPRGRRGLVSVGRGRGHPG